VENEEKQLEKLAEERDRSDACYISHDEVWDSEDDS